MQKGFTKPQTAQLSLHAVKSFSQQLESINYRKVGSGLCAKVNIFHQPTSSGILAKPSYILHQAKLADSSRGEHTTGERGNYCSRKPLRSQGLLLNPFPCPQKKEASYQPQEVQQMGETPVLQNGRHGDIQGTAEGE